MPAADSPAPATAQDAAPAKPPECLEGQVYGVVWSERGERLPEVAVTLRVRVPGAAPAQYRAWTDEFGRFALRAPTVLRLGRRALEGHRKLRESVHEFLQELHELPATSDASESLVLFGATALAALSEPLDLELHARSPRHGQARRALDPELLFSGEARRLDLVVDGSVPFGGRVLLGGRGLPGADVLLFDSAWRFQGATRSGAGGYFELGAPEAGLHRLHARMDAIGAGGSTGFYLTEDFQTLEQRVPLVTTDSILEVRLLLPDGSPLAGLELHACEEGLSATDPLRPLRPGLPALAQAELAGGLALSRSLTDSSGWARLPSMQPGSYVLEVDGLPSTAQPTQRASTEHATTITLEGHFLFVEIETEDDLRPGLRVDARRLDGEPGSDAALIRLPCDLEGRTFAVEAGSRWALRAAQGTSRGPEREVRIEPGVRVTRLRLEAPPAPEHPELGPRPEPAWTRYAAPPTTGSVRLAPDAEGGRPMRVGLWRLRGSEDWVQVARGRTLAPGDQIDQLSPGRYAWSLVGVEGQAEPSLEGAEDRTFDLAAGQVQVLGAAE